MCGPSRSPTTLAIMQPYLFPYIGYFQLIAAVDRFVLLDDVAYIKRGWINRNAILLRGRAHPFTLPVSGASQNVRILDLRLFEPHRWAEKFARTLRHAYRHAPFFEPVSRLVDDVLAVPSDRLPDWLHRALTNVCVYLRIRTEIVPGSSAHQNSHLRGAARIIDICRREGAGVYVNVSGGAALYREEDFARAGVRLLFIKPVGVRYVQSGADTFVPNLSILDVLMWNSPEQAVELLSRRSLWTPAAGDGLSMPAPRWCRDAAQDRAVYAGGSGTPNSVDSRSFDGR